MMRSLFSGVSGLKTHQTKMDVIGNNIANVNTTAFKSSSVTFSALMSQTTQNASGANTETGTGGVNARQIGLGVKSGAINTNISGQGSAQSTGNPFDIMITGSNFFVVSDGNNNYFTRDGSFYVDGVGNLAMTSIGYNVMGWQVDPETNDIKKDTVSALRIMSAANMTYPPESTSRAYVSGIIDENDTDVSSSSGKVMNLNFYDNLGYSYTAKLSMKETAHKGEYALELQEIIDSAGNVMDGTAGLLGAASNLVKDTVLTLGSNYALSGGKLTIPDGTDMNLSDVLNTDGTLKEPPTDETQLENYNLVYKTLAKAFGFEGSEADFYNYYIDDDVEGGLDGELMTKTLMSATMNAKDTITANYRAFTGCLVNFDTNTGKFKGINDVEGATAITMYLKEDIAGRPTLGGEFSNIDIDFATSSMFDNKGTSTMNAKNGDTDGIGTGRRLGNMSQVSVQNNGMIYAAYDNGMTRLLGQIATATFANASGLTKEGDNLYSASANSGDFDGIGVDVTSDGGYMSTGQLEMSNVDLSAEFTEMITTQRGFQANSRIITVSDTLLEELTNLKR